MVVGLITKSETVFVALAVVTLLMWLASTAAHAFAHEPSEPLRPAHVM
jgi:hypothetical protein